MAQYLTGTVSVTNGSATVTGSGTLWDANVTAGDLFARTGDNVTYEVASVDTDLQVTLNANYAGVTGSGLTYAIHRDFTSGDIPLLSNNDIETGTIFSRAMAQIQDLITNVPSATPSIIDNGNATAITIDASEVTTVASLVATTADINAGTVDATIGATTPAPITCTTFTSTGIDDNATATAITIDANEDISYTGTAQYAVGEGVVFNGDSISSANTLDDYEEGTWTPILSDGTNNATSSSAVGVYTKIGRMVHVSARLIVSSLGSCSGGARVTGLPFTSSSTALTYGVCSFGNANSMAMTAGYSLSGVVETNSTYITLYMWDAAAGQTTAVCANWSASGDAIFEATYYV